MSGFDPHKKMGRTELIIACKPRGFVLTVARQEAARCSLSYENEPIAVAGFLMIPDVISVDYKIVTKSYLHH